MASPKNPVILTVGGIAFSFNDHALDGFPEARAFLTDVMARGSVSAPVAKQYVLLAARLNRHGRLGDPAKLTHNVERTAANAYWRWQGEAYAERVTPVVRAIASADLTAGVSWLRRSSLVPPFEGKAVPRVTSMGGIQLDAGTQQAVTTAPTVGWLPCSTWTLHVPRSASSVVHADPCAACAPIELSSEQLELIAVAFEKAWGHRDLGRVPAESLLFGQPPRESVGTVQLQTSGKIVALLGPGALASAITGLGGSVTTEASAFTMRLKEGVDAVLVSKDALGNERFADAVESLNGIANEVARERGA